MNTTISTCIFCLRLIYIVSSLVCGGMISTSTGIIKSPYYPLSYPKNRECIYVISQPPGKSILLDFQYFDVEGAVDATCYFDYVEVAICN